MFARRQVLAAARRCARGLATADKRTKIGVVGCGNVGQAVIGNLVRSGFSVTHAFDTATASMAALPPSVTRCPSARAVAQAVDVVITGLPRPENVAAAAKGDEGILAGLSKDKVWIEHSTTDYEDTIRYARAAEEVGAHVLEAPITGGLTALQKGNMVVFLAGDPNVAHAMDPILKASYFERVFVGRLGIAAIVKLVSNMLAGVHLLAMGEALMLAKRADIDLKKFWEAIRLSAGTSFVWDTGPPQIFNGTYDKTFDLELFTKDMQLGYDLARKFKVPMDIHQHTLSTFLRAQYQYGDKVGCYMPPKALEDSLGISLGYTHFNKWTYTNEINHGCLVVRHDGIKDGYENEEDKN